MCCGRWCTDDPGQLFLGAVKQYHCGSEVESQTIAKNSIATEPAAPTYAGCTFTGWYLDGEPYDFSTPVTEDLTLIAAFELDETAVSEVIAKIDAIGEVEYTEASKAKIDDAKDAYDALTDAQKALVTNYATLTAAQARYAALKAAAEAQTNPTNPDQPSGGSGKCKWCGEDHSANFWQRIVGFWHTIFYFWAHLFGLR